VTYLREKKEGGKKKRGSRLVQTRVTKEARTKTIARREIRKTKEKGK